MSGRGAWLAFGALVLLLAGLLATRAGTPDSPDHSVFSDGPNGTSALSQYAGSLGHPVATIGNSFDLPAPPATLFVFDPNPYSAGEVSRLAAWVRSGGVLVYADDSLDTRLALTFDLHRGPAVAADGAAVTPAMAGVSSVGDGSFTEPYRPRPQQAVLLANPAGAALAVEEAFGQGRVVAIAAPEYLCNGFLQTKDNGRLAADLLGMAPGTVAFDEFHHDLGGSASGDWTRQPLGLGIFGGALLVFLGLLLRGRAFGPRLEAPGRPGRSAAEYATAVGQLLRRAGGRRLALDVADAATRRSLAARLGVRGDLPAGRFEEAIERRAPALAEGYREAAAEAAAGDRSEASLLGAARRLHALAYPMARK